MALTYSVLGQVDVATNAVGQTGGPTEATIRVADITIGTVSSDYSSGVALVASSLGCNAILGIIGGELRGSTGAIKPVVARWDVQNSKLRFYEPDIAATSATNKVLAEIVGSNRLAAGDIVRLTYIGI